MAVAIVNKTTLIHRNIFEVATELSTSSVNKTPQLVSPLTARPPKQGVINGRRKEKREPGKTKEETTSSQRATTPGRELEWRRGRGQPMVDIHGHRA